ncbi:fructosyl amine: oxygen oxidoreductase [Trichophyton benhamiae CBS 112371]|uniref:Fructosyl amine: oxygen oxidoreductase n=1 Tax=Arthroderma benhamiae (strain ATCC MYA-4681 / CBS 112371) TaxID=663331 RepID=D4AYS0_ARTBC|nr:fructosyl amine: oxygen oxidoreductase [Trichophyton benhamiae CBS 112371]EFE31740.1 fructosyl amine: oxygen oxidoreductase [Trichophyton benhamiae CBS 112371]
MSQLSKDSHIVIIGAGTWGISTALHLVRRGYTNIKVLDKYPLPSPISAGNDVNKFLELDSSPAEDYVSKAIAQATVSGWKNDPVFQPYYHDTGAIIAATSEAAREDISSGGGMTSANGWIPRSTGQEFRETMPQGVLTGDFPSWKGWWKKDGAGWVAARKSMESAAREAARLGVTFISGPAGDARELVYADGKAVRGVRTEDGHVHLGAKMILCAGAAAENLLDMKHQLRPTAWTLAHIKMTPEEAQLYKDLPVLFNVERGFFMEPDEDKHELKICDEHPGYCNWVTEAGKLKSRPFARQQIPLESEQRVRQFLKETMPHLASRPLSFARICWCMFLFTVCLTTVKLLTTFLGADTPDRKFLISTHPEHRDLVLGLGGSGHGFAHIPSIGSFIVDVMESKLDPRLAKAFRWRPETAVGRDWGALQGRYGPKGSNRVMNFQDISENEWTNIGFDQVKL